MRPLVTIAIPDLAGPVARTASLHSLVRHTREPHEVVLLVEEPSRQYGSSGSNDQTRHQIVVVVPFGAPAALNRLLAQGTTPYILLLESSAIVTANWLTRLLAAFDDPTVGLSGPSTNSSWNEQQVLSGNRGFGWSIQQIDAFAANIATRYCNQRHSLDTLHSLGDFCYLFKRSVAEQLGGFDEAYGAGPCWEIDFSTRAARAGFRALWVADAYVHRAPPTPRHNETLRRLFTTSKHLYQDRFCGLRLRGEKTTYEPHCRGEACEHFAPRELIQITVRPGFDGQSSVAKENTNSVSPIVGNECAQSQPVVEPKLQLPVVIEHIHSEAKDLPLISCIMPTRNRRTFVRQALAYFERQDYPNRELIIVDDGNDRIGDLIPSDARIRYIALPQQMSIGAKRNLACEQAGGSIIAHWDDDDWYAPHRLQHQVGPLLDKKADMTGLETSCFFDLSHWQAWTCTPELHRRLFVGDVHGGTLVYWRWVWERLAHYPNASVAEDALFLRQATQRGARLQKLPHANSFVYLRHDSNAWRFPLGSYLQPAGWKRVDLNSFLPSADLSFYIALSPCIYSTPPPIIKKSEDGPLISCIMPTCNRRRYIPQAIRYFLRQDYPNRELLILDDGSQPVADLVPADPRIRYIHLDTHMILGAKRNLACELAQGSIIAHWDDDDWSAPHRLRYQVEILEQKRADLCGTDHELFYEPDTNRAWLYHYPDTIRRWLAGATLCYRKAFWKKNPFPQVARGEDTRFVWSSRATNAAVVPDYTFYIGIVHATNTSRKTMTGPYWHPHPVAEIHHLLGSDSAFYYSQ